MTTTPGSHKNHLANEKSPYLLQHADNPVDWYPWGDEAFEIARRENKPIFLSIGYSTCHWCHVMAHESFEDTTVAALMNRVFVCIKVDREERPDIDQVYMTACQMMTGSGGWPLTILMTPDRQPFFAATYIPKTAMLSFIPRVEAAWRDQHDQLVHDAGHVSEALGKSLVRQSGDEIGIDTMRRGFHELGARFDSTYGGFGARPKFPTPHNLLFLLRYWKRTGDSSALDMVEQTLDHMRRGGIYDQVGFGFHRYSTDAQWLVPHFEKMLYDQALMLLAYTEAFQATGNPSYRQTAEEIAEYVMRDLSAPEGGFCSAEDADSEGEEGKFYLWTTDELARVLGADAEFAEQVFGATREGNYVDEASGRETGANILYLSRPMDELARVTGLSPADLAVRMASVRARLLAARATRVRPHRDDKVLTDWNGLMIGALARSGRVLGRPDHVERATRAAQFVLKHLARRDGELLHRYRDGDAAVPGMLDDYAFLSWGLCELYEATFDVSLLQRAIELTGHMTDAFAGDDGGLYMTAEGAESLLVRPREAYDGAVPSGNSVAMLNLARLSRFTGDMSYDARARKVGQAFAGQVSSAPSAHTFMLTAADFLAGPTTEIVLAGRAGAADVDAMRRAIETVYVPDRVLLFRPDDAPDPVIAIAAYTRDQTSQGGRATAYICRNFACERPTTDPADVTRSLGATLR